MKVSTIRRVRVRKRVAPEELMLKSGDTFGRWTVIKFSHKVKRGLVFLCRCVCGRERGVLGSNLRYGLSESCGCKRFDSHILPAGQAARNRMFLVYKSSAKKRGRLWGLTRELFEILISGDCYFCGQPPSALTGYYKAERTKVLVSGVDRLNNEEGYTEENTVSCCKTCNYAKRVMSESEFKSWIDRVYHHFVSGSAPDVKSTPQEKT